MAKFFHINSWIDLMQGKRKGRILYMKILSFVTTRIICFRVQSSLGRTTRTFWAATVTVPEKNIIYPPFYNWARIGQTLVKVQSWRSGRFQSVLSVATARNNFCSQIVSDAAGFGEIKGISSSTQVERKGKERIIEKGMKMHACFFQIFLT